MKKTVNVSLGQAQEQVEATAAAFKAAQRALVKASEAHAVAEAAHEKARINLNNVFNTIRSATNVSALGG